MNIEDTMRTLEYLDKTVTAGWFKWYDLKNSLEYPECHVLIYKIDDYFVAEVLDFQITASHDSLKEAFVELTEITREYLDEYRSRMNNGKLCSHKTSPNEYWNKFREIYPSIAMTNFINTDMYAKKSFIFNLYQYSKELDKEISNLHSIIQSQSEIMLNNKNKDQNEIIISQTRLIHDLQEQLGVMFRNSKNDTSSNFTLEAHLNEAKVS